MSKEMVINILADRPIAYHPDLARACGGVKAAVFLSQLLYWTDRQHRRDGFIYKTQKAIEEETGLSKYEQRTARKVLVEHGIIEDKLMGIPAKLHYRVNTKAVYAALEALYAEREEEGGSQEPQEEQERANQDVDNIHNKKRRTTATITESTAQSTCTPTGFDKPTPAQESFKALAEICDISLASLTSSQRGALNQSEAILRKKAGATPHDLRAFRRWWDAHFWLGQRGQPPKPHQVREEWGRFRAWSNEDEGVLGGFVDVTAERLQRERERVT